MKKRISTKWKALAVSMLTVLMCFVMCFSFAACGSTAPYIGDDGYWYVNGEKTEYKAQGEKGEPGDKGDKGDPGAKGDKGDKGDPGSSAEIGGRDDVYSPSADVTETLIQPKATRSGNIDAKGKFYSDYATHEEEQLANKELAIEIAAEGFTLLKNADNALPLRSEKKITVFGARSTNYVHSGGGSGSGTPNANGIAQSTVKGALENAGFSVNPKTIQMYERENASSELGMEYYTEAVTSTYKTYDDAALILFSRTGSEGGDLATHDVAGHSDPDDHYLQLTDNEEALIKHVKKYFPTQKIVVALNSSNVMQIPELIEEKTATNLGVDAVLWIGGPGNNGMEALGKILSGEVNPSGHTTDLWARDFKKAPTWTNSHDQTQHKNADGTRMEASFYHDGEATEFYTLQYREDIYMGYRYYETMATDMNAAEVGSGDKWYEETVLYPFGYGMSYTDFEWKLDNIAETATIDAANQTITMRVWVKNTGDVAGKDVVQVYYTAPYTKGEIEKASTNLVGFAKTDLLEPGEAQVVTVKFTAQEMASFDWNDANKNGFKGYELEAGDYVVSINRNSHEVVDSVTRTVSEDIKCETDYITGNKVEPIFVDKYTSVNDNLIENKISRANGLKQPEIATAEDRELTAEEYQRLKDQYSYRSYQDKPTDPWYVKEGGMPDNWTQATEHEEDYSDVELKLADMAGIPYNESRIVDGEVVVKNDANTEKWDEFMNQLTWTEMCDLIATGTGAIALPSIGKLADKSADGPVQEKGNPLGTLYPSAPILAATFNIDLAAEFGRAVGNDCIYSGVTCWLGPGLNTHRSPFTGRNFEYLSEDGMHAALIAENIIREVTAKGVLTYLKHFFLNDQEAHRMDEGGIATFATEQTMREIYLKPFEHVVKNGNCFAMMSSFNRVGYEVMATNWAAHRTLLRDEWGFTGAMVTDAWAKMYTSLDLLARAGDEQVLGQSSSFPENSLHYGEWSAADNCVKVAANAEAEDSKTYTVLSPTHYYAVRRSAQAVLYTRANSLANNNAYKGDAVILDANFSVGVAGSFTIKMPGFFDAEFSMSSDEMKKLPGGLKFDAASGTISGTVEDGFVGDYPVVVDVKCDGGRVSTDLTVNIHTADKWRSNGAGLRSDTITVKAGEEYDSVFDCPTYGYGTNVPDARNRHIFNWGVDAEGTKWSLNADRRFSDLIAKDRDDFVEYNEYNFEIWLDDTQLIEGGAAVHGLKFEHVKGTHYGSTQFTDEGSYEINTGARLYGTPDVGTYELKIVINAPWCGSKFGASSLYPPQFGAGWVEFEKTLTLVVEDAGV